MCVCVGGGEGVRATSGIIVCVCNCRDMVKRLINKMDFDALEVKIKKCKVRNYKSLLIWLPYTPIHTH